MASRLTILLLGLQFAAALAHTNDSSGVYYAVTEGFLCINSPYVETHSAVSMDSVCAILCSDKDRCQAFSLADGPCRLFVFDACSRSVRDCSCSRRGRLFVKWRWPGFEPGALCPTGYGDDLCGVKYRLVPETAYLEVQRERCTSDGGFANIADVVDLTELNHIKDMCVNKGANYHIFLDGYQPEGSQEPAGGWVWKTCGTPVDSSLWRHTEPDNSGSGEEAIVTHPSTGRLYDVAANSNRGAMCKCLSPFN